MWKCANHSDVTLIWASSFPESHVLHVVARGGCIRRLLKSRWRSKSNGEAKRRSRETKKWACSDLCKFSISTPRKSQKKIRELIFTGSMNVSISDFSGFHNNVWDAWLADFICRETWIYEIILRDRWPKGFPWPVKNFINRYSWFHYSILRDFETQSSDRMVRVRS